MALHLTLARPYAKAAFADGQKANQLEAWLAVFTAFSKIIKNKEVARQIINPKFSDKEIKTLLFDLIQTIEPESTKQLKDKIDHFLQLLIDEKRLMILPDIALVYQQLLNKYQDIIEASVTYVFPLNDEHRQQIKKQLEKRFNAEVKLKMIKDESLLGGVIIRAGNWVMDGSIKGKLTRLAENLKG
ncbi:F0F1 ATP synthase subunit delta [Coxiella burnetii]|uniref:F0F1 ATP synthase subunit delta n=1 Tax=Coxiella burnetii TaxID=777 RepID=UPI0021764F4D|nr:F0F1 ATP synthase subunit delta [Coxiella burnetii]